MKRITLLVAGLLCALLLPSSTPAQASMGNGTFTKYTDQPLPYYVYQPTSYTGGAAVPLVVYLHGCEQTAPEAAIGTRWNEEADAAGFMVVYPEQLAGFSGPLTTGNANQCWNFYDPVQVGSRTSGEPAQIVAITREVMAKWNIDPKRVYVVGVSGGGAEANVMSVLFPDLYAAAGVLAGCPYAACTDVTGTVAWGTWQRLGIQPRQVPAFVEGSVTDPVTNWALSAGSVEQYLGMDDFADDGLANGSVSRSVATTTNYGFDQTPQPGSGDACLPSSYTTPLRKVPCPGGVIGFQGTYPYTVQTFNDASGKRILEFWSVYGATHAYVGGDPAGSFTDPLGPAVTHGAWTFLSAHPLP